MNKKIVLVGFSILSLSLKLYAQDFVTSKKDGGSFPIVATSAATLYVDGKDYTVAQKATDLLQRDIEMVSGKKPNVVHTLPTAAKNMIIIGTLDHSALINQLVAEKKINVDSIKGKWEAYQLQVVAKPFKGVDQAFVIVGSDRRGTAYGVFELSDKMGVSPWYRWADVPVKKKGEVYITKGFKKVDAPKVKYRGFFINDEAPALSGWSKEKFGGFNHKFYEKVFELLLRMKANYLWPAMWGSAFNDDDPLNPKVADEYAIVMGTSHHEPLVRAHDEWRRHGTGKWNYETNEKNLKEFWKQGIRRMGSYENIVSIGMRGDGDEPMTEGTAIALLERIVKDQRDIISEVTGKPASETPQLWALYKEVQDYYDKGMRVPEDVTLLLCDDNWGNIRKLPKLGEKARAGGYGIYYHYDYVGGPRNYKWINTNQIERTWEQMHLAYRYGADRIWIVNVGDIKPMEFPTEFFLDYAWNPEQWPAEKLPAYYRQWAVEQFGAQYAGDIADILAKYTKYNSRRKPELLSPETYSLTAYNEADRVVKEYNDLLAKAERINKALPAAYRDAYYQLVLHPEQASANINELYVTVGKNKMYAKQGLAIANSYADKAKDLYVKDSLISKYYNDTLAGGKWSHMMDQTHIGYTYWQQPPFNKMPDVEYVTSTAATTVSSTNGVSNSVEKEDTRANQYIPKGFIGNAFTERNGYVSIEAPNYTKAIAPAPMEWKVIPNLGRTSSAVTPFPVTSLVQVPGGNSPRLEYQLFVYDTGTVKVHTYLSPTLDFTNTNGLKYAVSIDDEAPQIVNMHPDNSNQTWGQWVANNINIQVSQHHITKPGQHVLKFWMVNPGVVLQKLVVDFGGLQQSYLGPQETRIK